VLTRTRKELRICCRDQRKSFFGMVLAASFSTALGSAALVLAIHARQASGILGSLVFLAVGIILSTAVIYAIFSLEDLRLDEHGIAYSKGMSRRKPERQIILADISEARICRIGQDEGPDIVALEICVAGDPLIAFQHLPEKELNWLVYVITQRLNDLRRAEGASGGTPTGR